MIDIAPLMLADVAHVEDWDASEFKTPLWMRFRRKCYICERHVRNDFQVDHRVPQNVCTGGLSPLVHCSVNLFPSCAFCNVRRSRKLPATGGLLTPGSDTGIEARLQQRFSLDAPDPRAEFAAVDPSDLDACNTAEELQRLHSPDTGTTETAIGRTYDLLDDIQDRFLTEIHPLATKVGRERRRGRPDPRLESQLVAELTRDTPFTMLMHSLVAQLHPDLCDLLDRALRH
jgi:hypothetical protein